MNLHDGLLHIALEEPTEFVAALLAAAILRGHAYHPHAVEFFHRGFDLRLGGLGIDFKAVALVLVGRERGLFRHQRATNDSGRLHYSASFFAALRGLRAAVVLGLRAGGRVLALGVGSVSAASDDGLLPSSSLAFIQHVPSRNDSNASLSTTKKR